MTPCGTPATYRTLIIVHVTSALVTWIVICFVEPDFVSLLCIYFILGRSGKKNIKMSPSADQAGINHCTEFTHCTQSLALIGLVDSAQCSGRGRVFYLALPSNLGSSQAWNKRVRQIGQIFITAELKVDRLISLGASSHLGTNSVIQHLYLRVFFLMPFNFLY